MQRLIFVCTFEEKVNTKRAKMAILTKYRSPEYQTHFESIGLSVQEEFKIDFQDGDCSSHLRFPIRKTLVILLTNHPILPAKFLVNWPFCSREEVEIDLKDCSHLGFLIEMILAVCYLKVTQILPTKFRINKPFSSGEGSKYISRCCGSGYVRFSLGTILAIFHLQVTPIFAIKFRVNRTFGS